MSLQDFAFVTPLMTVAPWFLVIMYLIPIIGTLVAMIRRVRSVWSFGGGIRKRIPENPVSRRLKQWSLSIRTWWGRTKIYEHPHVWSVNAAFGKVEYLFGHLRDYTIGVVMTAGAVYNLTMCLLVSTERVGAYFDQAFYFGFFALLSLYTYRRHVSTGIKLTEFIRVNPWVHPQEFFDRYYEHLGPLSKPIPEKATRTVDPREVSYLTGTAAQSGYGRLAYGFYDTAIFARSAYKALDLIGKAYGRDGFDVWSSLWGSRIIQLFRSKLRVRNAEKFGEVEGKVILVFNHKSHLDFVLNFFALSKVRLKNGARIRPRYIAAKDHFVDNKFVYSGLGVGNLIENVDMVFIDRKGKGVGAITQAAHVLADKDVAIAMYPQGTRAYGNLGWNRERRDAGFYTTGSARRLKERLGHLKKGVAFLAMDTAIELLQQKQDYPVNLVFVGIEGTADLVPKGSFKVRTESEVTFTVGDVLTIHPSEVVGMEKPIGHELTNEGQRRYTERVDQLMEEINAKMVGALDLHHKLIDRFIQDLRQKNFAPSEHWMNIKNRLTQADQQNDLLPFQVLDRIYALDPSYWEGYLKRFANIYAYDELSRHEQQTLNEEVVDYLLKTRGRLMKAATMSETKRVKKAS